MRRRRRWRRINHGQLTTNGARIHYTTVCSTVGVVRTTVLNCQLHTEVALGKTGHVRRRTHRRADTKLARRRTHRVARIHNETGKAGCRRELAVDERTGRQRSGLRHHHRHTGAARHTLDDEVVETEVVSECRVVRRNGSAVGAAMTSDVCDADLRASGVCRKGCLPLHQIQSRLHFQQEACGHSARGQQFATINRILEVRDAISVAVPEAVDRIGAAVAIRVQCRR